LRGAAPLSRPLQAMSRQASKIETQRKFPGNSFPG
jgi:hypothetical protein